ncbi:MAG: hypothetical protein JWQ04_2364 [Pedosphaera sp.]|nr:hypothetical protein [Pedosphaera sp.]
MAMIAITAKAMRHGRKMVTAVLVPANHTEASTSSAWGLVIAGGLLLAATTFICLLLFAA